MIVERTAVVPLALGDAWEAFFGNEMQNWCELSDVVVEIRDYRMRPDGTPEYVMVNRMGPLRTSHRSDYVVFDPPHHAEDDTLESTLGGRWATIHEPVEKGTGVTHRWDVEPHGLMKLLFPLMLPIFKKQFQADLDQMVSRIRSK
jgi:hypothetical protein